MSDLRTISPDELPGISEIPEDLHAVVFSPGGPLQAVPYEKLLTKLIAANLAKPTKAAIDADLAHPADSVALVFGDPAIALNGWYRKLGASGAGGWEQFEELSRNARIVALEAAQASENWAEGAAVSATSAQTSADNVLLGAAAFTGPTVATYPALAYGIKRTPENLSFGLAQPGGAFPRIYTKLLSSAAVQFALIGWNGLLLPKTSRLDLPDPAQFYARVVELTDGLSGQYLMRSDGEQWRSIFDNAPVLKYPAADLIYVSSVNANGIPVGNDGTGTGSAAAPYLTLDKGLLEAVNGKVILFNGSPSAPTVYTTASTFVTIVKGVTFDSVVPYGATIRGVGSVRVINVALTTDLTFGLGQITIDGADLYAGVTQNAPANLYSVSYRGTRFIRFVSAAVSPSSGARCRYTVRRCYFENDPNAVGTLLLFGAIYIFNLGDGGTVDVTDNVMRLTNHQGSPQGAIRVLGSVAGQVANCQRNQITMSIAPGLAGSGQHFGILLQNVRGHCDDSSVRLTGGNALHVGFNFRISPPESGTVFTTNGSSMDRCIAYNDTNGGMMFMAGPDQQGTVADGNVGTVSAIGCVGFGTARSIAGGLHGVFVGGGGTINARRCWVENTQLGYVDKVGSGSIFTGNVSVNATQAHFRLKGGSGGKFIQNTLIQRPGAAYGGTAVLVLENDIPTATPTTSYTIRGNNISIPTMASGGRFLNIGANDVVTMTANNWFGGSGSANPWRNGLTNYATFAAYQAAIEASATQIDPQFVDASQDDYQLRAASLLRGSITRDIDATVDFLGNTRPEPASVGAFEAAA